jgi:hypothetical protein
MAHKSFTTLDDVRTIVSQQIPEGTSLEYKRSTVLIDRDANTVCKAVSALANSAGGTLVIGVETRNSLPVQIDEGTPPPSRRDWLYQIISGGTFPAVELLEIREFQTSTGAVYIVDVPTSPQAPHQSLDRKYYKRRGPHSEVMEHYEIEDVRNRPKRATAPLRAELEISQGVLAHLHLSNSHETDPIIGLNCQIEANFPIDRSGLQFLSDRGVHSLLSRSSLYFHLGSMMEILRNTEPVATFQFRYTFNDKVMTQSVAFHFADLNRTTIMTSPLERALGKIGEKIDRVGSQLERLYRRAEALTGIVDGTGLRISQRTLSAIKDQAQMFDPREFGPDGYVIVADISEDDAHALHRIFNRYTAVQAAEQYEQLSAELRQRFEKHFKVRF